MMEVLEFKDYVVEKYGNFAEVELQVFVKDKEIDQKIPVTFLSDYMGMSFAIMWESVGFKKFEKEDLAGLYYSTGDNMIYDSNQKTLTIIDKNGMEIILTA